MSSVRELRRRIQSIKNIGKMTKAMQMVASSKIKRAQERVEQSRPYVDAMQALLTRIIPLLEHERGQEEELMKPRKLHTIGMLVMTPDHNLCGALPATINRKAIKTMQEERKRVEEEGRGSEVQFIAVGKRGRDFLHRSGQPVVGEFTSYGDWPSLQVAAEIAHYAAELYLNGDVDNVLLVYSSFVSVSVQRPTVVQLLPVQALREEVPNKRQGDMIFEPEPANLLRALLPRYLNALIYRALLESIASEQAAQMLAMKQASDNANELVKDLTLVMNKARQASITTQILEVISGAESLG